MTHSNLSNRMRGRALALVACATLVVPMAAAIPPASLTPMATTQMSTKKKVVLLAGAAALYYLYRHHQAKKAQANVATQENTIYYLSKNGRVYYRDANHQAHWVTPPPQGISVPADEATSYRGLQGYDRSTAGETNLSRFAARNGGM